jgi:zona occludens toxin
LTAVAYHLIPAIESGRKVITNLPLNIDYLNAVYGADRISRFVEVRTKTFAQKPSVDWSAAEHRYKKFGIVQKTPSFIDRVFANLEDYQDEWRHPETGTGALYIIDECHFCLPLRNTQIAVEEWYSMHRHSASDVLLITQSYGKVSKSIIELVQLVYRVKKATAFGTNDSYIRKVQDGIKGEVVNTEVRSYESKYFKFYRSHTKGGGKELEAKDVRPIWYHWSFVGALFFFLVFAGIMFSGKVKNPFKIASVQPASLTLPHHSPAPTPTPTPAPTPAPVSAPLSVPPSLPMPKSDKPNFSDPYSENGIHIVGMVTGKQEGKEKRLFILGLSKNGQIYKHLPSSRLVALGYRFVGVNECAAYLVWGTQQRFIQCDIPKSGKADQTLLTFSR